MHSYQPPLEISTLYFTIFADRKEDIKGYNDLLPEFTNTMFGEAGKLASEVISPSNKDGDEQGCRLENGIVRTPDSFKVLLISSEMAAGCLSILKKNLADWLANNTFYSHK